MAEQLDSKQAHLQVLDQNIDTTDATGRLLFNVLGAIALFETENQAERQIDWIKNAKVRGVSFGRKSKLTPQQCAELRNRRAQGELIRVLMEDYNLSKASVYRYLKDAEDTGT